MTNRLSDAMNKLHVEGSRNSIGRPPPSPGPGAKRNSGMDPNIINAMFPDAAAAIAKQKADYTQQTGVPPSSNRNSTVGGERNSLVAPTISAPVDTSKDTSSQSANPWAQRQPELRPKSSSGQQPMGQFSQAPPSAGLRSPRPFQLSGSSNTQNTTLLAADNNVSDMPILSPYALGNASWASMSNTPMVPNFNTQQQHTQADMVANATAMKLAALSTVNNRIALDDVKKYRRTKSNDNNMGQMPMSPGIQGTNVLVVNESGQLLNSQPLSVQQLATIQAQQQAAMAMRGARPDSPGLAMQGAGGMGGMSFTSPQNNGFLAAHDGSFGAGGGPLNLNQFGMGHGGSHEGYLSDHSEIARGRSPRGRRGSSKPPEDPTDIALLQDIPNWLRSLRLHKYTDNLKDLKWTDLIDLDDKGLEDRGVNALGARRKMLKVSLTLIRCESTEGKMLTSFTRYSRPLRRRKRKEGLKSLSVSWWLVVNTNDKVYACQKAIRCPHCKAQTHS